MGISTPPGAKNDGRLFALPRDDWPPGYPRDQRALRLSRLASEDRPALYLTVRKLFNFTPSEVQMFLLLIQSAFLPRDRLNMSSNCTAVHVSRIRKRLKPYGISIVTFWGCGYQIPSDDRKKALDLVLRAAPPLAASA